MMKDGRLLKNHSLFSVDQTCYPLGSHVKEHKVGIVFFSVGNIHSKFQLALKPINLHDTKTFTKY